MGNPYKSQAYKPKQQTGTPPQGCAKCKCGFQPEGWPRSGWTLSGFSPWCPTCHADHAPADWNRFNNRRKPGPKPKALKHDVDNA